MFFGVGTINANVETIRIPHNSGTASSQNTNSPWAHVLGLFRAPVQSRRLLQSWCLHVFGKPSRPLYQVPPLPCQGFRILGLPRVLVWHRRVLQRRWLLVLGKLQGHMGNDCRVPVGGSAPRGCCGPRYSKGSCSDTGGSKSSSASHGRLSRGCCYCVGLVRPQPTATAGSPVPSAAPQGGTPASAGPRASIRFRQILQARLASCVPSAPKQVRRSPGGRFPLGRTIAPEFCPGATESTCGGELPAVVALSCSGAILRDGCTP